MTDLNILNRNEDLVYATKGNIARPGTAAHATASQAAAATELAARYTSQLSTKAGG